MSRYMTIEGCTDCPHRDVETTMGHCTHSCYYGGNYVGFIFDGAAYNIPKIPDFCPLPKSKK